ncbi:MAG: glycosyltransferase family 2 protein [Kangiellaceae bacterium]|nr:glycosyltransferase family 2 protein [Kangiellaceae bacterium]MCW9018160.1 glycosyltransferase family 2 protein [Kangiellaceae bacterium]
MNNNRLFSPGSILLLTGCFLITATVFCLAIYAERVNSSSIGNIKLWMMVLLSPVILKFALQLVVLPFHFYREWLDASEERNLHKVSVLIPAWNEQVGIIKTIQSVLDTRYADLEVIVINDGSTDATHELVSAFIDDYQAKKYAKSQVELKYIRLANGGKARALNHGVRMAGGDIIFTIDADSLMDKNAIENIVGKFRDPNVGAVAGNVIVGNRSKPIELIQQLEYLCGFFFKRSDGVFNSVHIIGGAAAAYRKEVLIQVGGFDKKIITEDVEMSIRILRAGYKTKYAAGAVVFTEGPSDWNSLCNQRLRWKFGRILTYIKHKELFFSTQRQHSPYLSFILLPISLYVELLLLCEGIILGLFFTYVILTNDYIPLVLLIGFVSCLIWSQILLDSKYKSHSNLILFAPVAWLLFYIVDAIECLALARSLKRLYKRENLEWQKWVRVGLVNHSPISDTLVGKKAIAEVD